MSASFSLTIFARTAQGDANTLRELEAMYREAGFCDGLRASGFHRTPYGRRRARSVRIARVPADLTWNGGSLVSRAPMMPEMPQWNSARSWALLLGLCSSLSAPTLSSASPVGQDRDGPAPDIQTVPSPPNAGQAPAAGEKDRASDERHGVHFQTTIATQSHPAFAAAYSGRNSMLPAAESATSVVADLFTGLRGWRGSELYFQPEIAGGRGLSSTLGMAAFPSGEVYRVGDPTPTVIVGRVFLRQVIGLGGGTTRTEAGPNQLAGTRDRDALTLTVGKVATTDIVDANPLSNDPHSGFTSWGLWASAAYDYPADTRGYTWGAAADLSINWWSVRGGIFLEPKMANGLEMESVSKARGLVLEGEARFSLDGRAGAVRALTFLNEAHMGNYGQAIAEGVDVSATRAYGRKKYGFAASTNLQIDDTLGAFVRASWNDGASETWAFTEIDRSFAAGVVQSGARWRRSQDAAGAALVVSGLSDPHRAYLAAGGYGFLIGDSRLRYRSEILAELFYRLALTREVSLIGAYQPVANPAFNADRGPVHIFTARVHVGF